MVPVSFLSMISLAGTSDERGKMQAVLVWQPDFPHRAFNAVYAVIYASASAACTSIKSTPF